MQIKENTEHTINYLSNSVSCITTKFALHSHRRSPSESQFRGSHRLLRHHRRRQRRKRDGRRRKEEHGKRRRRRSRCRWRRRWRKKFERNLTNARWWGRRDTVHEHSTSNPRLQCCRGQGSRAGALPQPPYKNKHTHTLTVTDWVIVGLWFFVFARSVRPSVSPYKVTMYLFDFFRSCPSHRGKVSRASGLAISRYYDFGYLTSLMIMILIILYICHFLGFMDPNVDWWRTSFRLHKLFIQFNFVSRMLHTIPCFDCLSIFYRLVHPSVCILVFEIFGLTYHARTPADHFYQWRRQTWDFSSLSNIFISF